METAIFESDFGHLYLITNDSIVEVTKDSYKKITRENHFFNDEREDIFNTCRMTNDYKKFFDESTKVIQQLHNDAHIAYVKSNPLRKSA